jgi:hypothetical protein
VSALSDLLSLLGLSQPGGPVSNLHQLIKWASVPLTIDGPTVQGPPPSGYQISSTTRDMATLEGRMAKLPSGTLAALKNRGLIGPDATDNTKFQVNLELRIVYPSVPGQPHQVGGTGKLPVVLLNHGAHPGWVTTPVGGPVTGVTITRSQDGYAYLQDALAQHGIISVSVDHNFANFTESHIETRADTIIAALTLLSAENTDQTSRYFGRLDFTNIGLMGHSRGGDAVVRAVQKITASSALSSQYTVEAVCSLAPTDFTGGAGIVNHVSLGPGDTNFYLVVYGALDADIFGGYFSGNDADSYPGSGFRHYDRAGVSKAMVFLDNCCHNPFNTVWLADGNDSNDSRVTSAADHQSIAVDYIGDLFRWQLKGEALGGRFDGRTPNSAGQHAALQWQFGQTVRKIEDFENAGANDLGGARTVANPGNVPATIELFAKITINGTVIGLNNTSHQTNVLHVDVTQAAPGGTRVMSTDIPATSQDWTALDTLIFSLSGWFDPTSIATVAAANLPRITITLLDSSGASAVADFNVYGATLPSRPVWKRLIFNIPHQPTVTLTPVFMRLETIPIALTAFTGISLSAVAHLALDIVLGNNTHVFVDNISVVKRQ